MNQPSQAPFIGIMVEALLRPCEIYPVAAPTGNGYLWEWASPGGEAHSANAFEMFFDCLQDARATGYEPHFLDRQPDLVLVPVPPRTV